MAATAGMPLWIQCLTKTAFGSEQDGPKPPVVSQPGFLSPGELKTVDILSDLILPQTDTPGARAARVHLWIDYVLSVSGEEERRPFRDGLAWLNRKSQNDHHQSFVGLSEAQQIRILSEISAYELVSGKPSGIEEEFFAALKRLVLIGYYTSREGMTTELGWDGKVFYEDYAGCRHPEHQKGSSF